MHIFQNKISTFIHIFTLHNFLTLESILRKPSVHDVHCHSSDRQMDRETKRETWRHRETDRQITFFNEDPNEDPILAYNRKNVLFIDRVLIQSFRSNRYARILGSFLKQAQHQKGTVNIKQKGIDSKCKLITVLIKELPYQKSITCPQEQNK